nr:zinc finger protein 239 isoform X2 [Danio rerio]|eukprot:XP_005160138.1 zinc finger protein 239 isoform X2 [Danio rerio]
MLLTHGTAASRTHTFSFGRICFNTMANIITFQTQITSVIEVLANAAVAEICKLVEDSYADLQLEISQTQKENSLLKKRLKMIEIRDSFYRRANKLRNESTALNKTSVREKQSGRISVKVSSVCSGANHEEGHVRSSNSSVLQQQQRLDQQAYHQSVEDGEPDVLIIKEERPENTRCEQSEREKQTTENHKDEALNKSSGVCVAGHRENFIDQNTVQHCHQESDAIQPDLLQDENTEVNAIDEDTHLLNGDTRMERRCDGEVDSNLQPVSSYASWVSRRFDASANHPSYTESECNGGPSVNQYLMYRGSTDPMCSYATPINSNSLSVSNIEGHLTHDNEGNISQSEQPPFTPCFSFKQSDSPHMQRKDRFMCKHCGKVFSQPGTLLLHQKLHTRERLHNCTLCGKRFSQASSLKRHHSIHRGEKPFRCQHCGKHFSDQSNLKKHVTVHTGEKPYGCSLCGKMFNQSSNLKTHMKIHTREKPFGCDRCGRMFAHKYILVKHQQRICMSTGQV